MTLSIKFTSAPSPKADTAILFILPGKKIMGQGSLIDRKAGGFITEILKHETKFTGKAGDTKLITLPAKAGFRQALLIGAGEEKSYSSVIAENAGGKTFAAAEAAGAQHAVLIAEKFNHSDDFYAHFAFGALLRSYKFLKYKTPRKDAPKTFNVLEIMGAQKSEKIFAHLKDIARGVFFARDVVNEPPSHLYPETFAQQIKKFLSPLGITVEIIDEKKMQKLDMGAALAVGQGSERPPRMVVMQWKGKQSGAPVALVGKGITFDTGGISIKPGPGMEEMKMDMGGAAAVVGTMGALALNKTKAHVVGIVALAENMPSGNAYRPADILTSYAGKTIEVLNTDAEGRLVLADALSYIQDTYKPKLVIDLATLTGAMMVALGNEYCGVFANDDKLWSQIETAGKSSGEKIWRMPLDPAWKKEVEGTITDLQNMGKSRFGGACIAAGFLEHFIKDKTPWAHFDIAGTAWVKADQPTVPKYGTGFGVRLLYRLVQDHFG